MNTTIFDACMPVSSVAEDQFELVTLDLYRNIHKGIRAELFNITQSAGRIDPCSRVERARLAEHIIAVGDLLAMHAHQEDTVIDPVLHAQLPDLAGVVELDHAVLGPRFAGVVELARHAVEAGDADERRLTHLLYLELSGFTSAYLAHQGVEERIVMPALLAVAGVEAVTAMHGAIGRNIPPDVMRRGLAFMLPAMNIEERAAALTGTRRSAPAEVFAAVSSLARSVLAPADYAALAARLEE